MKDSQGWLWFWAVLLWHPPRAAGAGGTDSLLGRRLLSPREDEPQIVLSVAGEWNGSMYSIQQDVRSGLRMYAQYSQGNGYFCKGGFYGFIHLGLPYALSCTHPPKAGVGNDLGQRDT